MTNIIDKRFTTKDGSVINRQKFIKRYKDKLKEAVKGIVGKQSVKDFKFNDQKVKIKVGDKDLDLPDFSFDPDGGVYSDIAVGNKTFRKGDIIEKPLKVGAGGRGGSDQGEGEDSFEFVLSEKEFADLFFEDLALPDLIKKKFTGDSYEIQRAGYSNTGGPSSLSIKQTIIRAFMRRYAMKKARDKEGDKLIINDGQITVKPKKKISFLEDIDLKYNYRDKVELPSTKAVMFCLMDVSGSMGEREKDIAKRFFILLNMFLKRNYQIVDVIFIRHAEWAEECSEEVFFHDRASGGTVISSGYEKIIEVISSKYNSDDWNIYISQATDGDNFEHDDNYLIELLTKKLLPITQYFAYTEISSEGRRASNVYKTLLKVKEQFKNLAVTVIHDYSQIFEVFHSLFTREKK